MLKGAWHRRDKWAPPVLKEPKRLAHSFFVAHSGGPRNEQRIAAQSFHTEAGEKSICNGCAREEEEAAASLASSLASICSEKERRKKGERSLGAGRMDKKGYREDGGRQEMRWR